MNKTAIVKWHPRNKEWYENKGYIFTGWRNEFEVKVEDLSEGSKALVNVICDGCGKPFTDITWQQYRKYVKKDKFYCLQCSRNGYKKYISFYDWCYENLSKEEADKIILRWDNNLNVDRYGNQLTPKNVACGSHGFDEKGYWFKCLDYPEHKSEIKSIKSFTNKKYRSIDCNQCNIVSITSPYLIKFLVNIKDADKYSMGSHTSIPMKCPYCGYKKDRTINHLTTKGFNCRRCSDGVSYPEKFIFNILYQLNIDFKTQLNYKVLKWCCKYRYDFYLNNTNCIIEAHGMQHYEESNWDDLIDIQENDKQKEKLAKENGIDNYIIIDCKYSDMDWIKDSIMQSELPQLLDFKEDDIDWLKCHEYACKSLVKVVCNMWNSGINNISKIAKKLRISKKTVNKYLKQGNEFNLCSYNARKEYQKRQCIKVICLTTSEIFDSLKIASDKYNIKNISECCQGKQKSAGKHPITGEKLVWMYYDKWLEKQGAEVPADNIQDPIKRGIDKVC